MSFVRPDIIEGNGGRFTIKGWEFTRIFTVEGLTSAGSSMMVEATVALNIPIGTPHPAIPTARAIEFNPESIPGTGNAARVTVLYREFSQDIRVDIGSRVVNKETTEFFTDPNNRNSAKDDMVLVYTYPDDYDKAEGFAGIQVKDGLLLSKKEYPSTINITRTEFETISADGESGHPLGIKLTGAILTDRTKLYNGKTNKAGWDLRPFDPEHVWQCQISATSAEEGLAYRVTYAFSYDTDKWQYVGTFKDPNTGEPVPDPEEGNNQSFNNFSRKRFDQYLAEDFNLLELF